MKDILTIFTAIGDYFTKSDWSAMVKWPFWILLFTVAAGGVYCARFGKKTLLNQGFTGMLNLVVTYMAATIAYIRWPLTRDWFEELPFLSVTEEFVSLLDPFKLEPGVLAPLLLRLMLLVLVVNGIDALTAGGKTKLSWVFLQAVTTAFSLAVYSTTIFVLTIILPACLNRCAIVLVILAAVIGVLMLFAKLIFTILNTGGNPYFSAVYKFFTVNKFGSLLTTSALTLVLSMIILIVMQLTKTATLLYTTVNTDGLCVILLMLLVTFYIFSMVYNDKKKV